MTIAVNGRPIAEAAILAEMQYHPSASQEEALRHAAHALVVRELLLQRAEAAGLAGARDGATAEEGAIAELLARDVPLPEAGEAECRRWYEHNTQRFSTATLFEASHILFLARRDDLQGREQASRRAREILVRLSAQPHLFVDLARRESACSSAREGGRLGQIGLGETAPEIDTILMALAEGQICPVPVETEAGVHIVRLDRRMEGRPKAFADVLPAVRADLRERAFRVAVAQYLSLLAGEATIEGIEIPRATSPLVQ